MFLTHIYHLKSFHKSLKKIFDIARFIYKLTQPIMLTLHVAHVENLVDSHTEIETI